jgi:hypothetical protein
MPLDFQQWGILQWTFYSIALGIMGGIIGNFFATTAIQYYNEKLTIKGKSLNWKSRFYWITFLTGGLIAIIFFIIIFS